MSEEKKEEKKQSSPWWMQKTNWMIAFSFVLIALKYFGVIDSIPTEYAVNAGISTVVLIVLKSIKWAIYLVIGMIKKSKAKNDED